MYHFAFAQSSYNWKMVNPKQVFDVIITKTTIRSHFQDKLREKVFQ